MDSHNDRRTQDEPPDGRGRSEFVRDPLSEERLSAYLDGECSAAEQAQLEERIAGSPEFRQFVDELRSVRSSLELLPQYRLRPDFAEHVLRRAEREVLTGGGSTPDTSGGAVARAAHDDVTTLPVGEISRRSYEPNRSARPFLWTLAALAAAVLLLITNRDPEIRRDEIAKGPAPPSARETKKSADVQSGQADAPMARSQEATNLSDLPDRRSTVADDSVVIGNAVDKSPDGKSESIVERAKEEAASTLTIDAKNKVDGIAEKLADRISAGGAGVPGPELETAETRTSAAPLAASTSGAGYALPGVGDDLHVIEVVVTRDAWQRGAVQARCRITASQRSTRIPARASQLSSKMGVARNVPRRATFHCRCNARRSRPQTRVRTSMLRRRFPLAAMQRMHRATKQDSIAARPSTRRMVVVMHPRPLFRCRAWRAAAARVWLRSIETALNDLPKNRTKVSRRQLGAAGGECNGGSNGGDAR